MFLVCGNNSSASVQKGFTMIPDERKSILKTNHEKSMNHPCFYCGAAGNAKIHLPVALKCNIKCKYCMDGYDCVNESVTKHKSTLLLPQQAAERFVRAKEKIIGIKVAGISGPGEPLANFDEVRETFKLIRNADPNVILCISTNGLMLPIYASHLISLGITHVSVTVNAVTPETGAKIYDYITYLGNVYKGEEGANILIQNQMSGISYLSSKGIMVRMNCLLFGGINQHEAADICLMAKECGCVNVNLVRVNDYLGINQEPISMSEYLNIQNECQKIISQFTYSNICNAEAVSLGRHCVYID